MNSGFMIDYLTKNESAVKMSKYLKEKGISNNTFMLRLYDEELQGVDPLDHKLSKEMKARVLLECSRNIWYFFREVVKIEVTGASLPFIFNTQNLAQIYTYTKNLDTITIGVRCTGKDMCERMLNVYTLLHQSNTQMLINNNTHNDSKHDLLRIHGILSGIDKENDVYYHTTKRASLGVSKSITNDTNEIFARKDWTKHFHRKDDHSIVINQSDILYSEDFMDRLCDYIKARNEYNDKFNGANLRFTTIPRHKELNPEVSRFIEYGRQWEDRMYDALLITNSDFIVIKRPIKEVVNEKFVIGNYKLLNCSYRSICQEIFGLDDFDLNHDAKMTIDELNELIEKYL